MANSPRELHPASVAVNKDDLVIPVNPPLRLSVGGVEMLGYSKGSLETPLADRLRSLFFGNSV